MTRPRIVVLGYGNTLRGDDGFGCRAAQQLASLEGRHVRVIASHQLSVDFAELIADAELVVFIDAAREGPPGEMRISAITDAELRDEQQVMTHHLTPQTLLMLSRTLYGGAPEALVVTVTGEAFDLSEELSPVVEAKVGAAVELVAARVREHAAELDQSAG